MLAKCRFPADATVVFEFSRLPDTLHTRILNECHVPAASVYFPKNYSMRRKYPLLLFMGGGSGGPGRNPAFAREIVNAKDFLCVNLPLFKKSVSRLKKDESNKWSRMLILQKESSVIWHAHGTMLKRIFSVVPNIDRKNCFMGGFSNGANTTVILLNRPKSEIRKYFNRFFLVEGGNRLQNMSALKGVPLMIMEGDKRKERMLDPVFQKARESGAKAKFVLMKKTGHEFPDRYRRQLRRWIVKNRV